MNMTFTFLTRRVFPLMIRMSPASKGLVVSSTRPLKNWDSTFWAPRVIPRVMMPALIRMPWRSTPNVDRMRAVATIHRTSLPSIRNSGSMDRSTDDSSSFFSYLARTPPITMEYTFHIAIATMAMNAAVDILVAGSWTERSAPRMPRAGPMETTMTDTVTPAATIFLKRELSLPLVYESSFLAANGATASETRRAMAANATIVTTNGTTGESSGGPSGLGNIQKKLLYDSELS